MTGAPQPGAVAPRLAAEHPELRLWWLRAPVRGRAGPELRARLRDLSDRFRGPQALVLRSRPVVHAYRVFFRHVGLDPDSDRVPVEALAVERLRAGGLRSRGVLADALTIATMETSVGVWALDAATVTPPLELREACAGEPLGRGGGPGAPLAEGRLVVADGGGPVAVLFGEPAPGHAASAATEEALLFAVQVAGVPAIHVSEALWIAADIMSAH